MAGIGFEIRKILEKDTFLSVLQAYGFAGLISSGPWVLSILAVMVIGVISLGLVVPSAAIVQFLVSVTYLMASSLTLTGVLQLLFTRFVADRLYEQKQSIILPNIIGALLVVSVSATIIAVPILSLFTGQSTLYVLLMHANFLVLCNLWIVLIFLSSMKAYTQILLLFSVGYTIAVIGALSLAGFGLEGLLGGVLLGHGFLLFSFLFLIVREYPGDQLVAFDFLKGGRFLSAWHLPGSSSMPACGLTSSSSGFTRIPHRRS
ncbi:exopolysaccharide Pel transporter PelG [Microbulbifer taiwanensis]|uniref:exopolysaccharide Pel transporter PelG n=1 Tax=Microbulbifer taiwanensis TaxID=986746 RepID=UPI00360EA919